MKYLFVLVALPKALHQEAARFRIHHALLDTSLHTLYAGQQYRGSSMEIHVPYAIEEVQMLNTWGCKHCHSMISRLLQSRETVPSKLSAIWWYYLSRNWVL